MDIKNKYILYARKSSESKERQALSIDDQISECTSHALSHNLVSLHVKKESKSAFKPNNRPAFDEMIRMLNAGEVDSILTWKPDRLCRNPEEGGKLLQLLQDGKIREIRTATGETYTQDSDHLILQIHFGMANQYSRNLSQNVKRGIKHKIERGEYPRPAPIGYKTYGHRGQKNIKPHSVESEFVKNAFLGMASKKYSLETLRLELMKKGMTTKKGKKISKSHLHNILTCPTYYGYFLHKDELYEGNFEPIISKNLFDKVQTILSNRSKPKNYTWEDHHVYNGLISCPECGCAVSTTVKKKVYKSTGREALYTYHHCTHRKGKCDQKPITTKHLEKQLIEEIGKITIDEETWNLGMKLLKEMHQKETGLHSKQRKQWQKKFADCQDRINALIDMRADGELTRDEFMLRKQLLLEEKANIQAKLNDTDQSSMHWLELAENFLETAYNAKEVMTNGGPKQKRGLILSVGENLFLKDKKIDFRFKKPYDVLLKPSYRSDMLPG